MRHPLHAFFFTAGRPAVAVSVGACLLGSWGAVSAMSRGALGAHADTSFLYTLVLPGLAGLVSAQILQELQHCSFTWPLPGVRGKTAFGFFIAGATVALIVVAFNAPSSASGPTVLLAVGFVAYCLGSLIFDPLSAAVSAASLAVGLVILTFSATAAELSSAHPVILGTVVVPAMAGVCLWRLFSRRTFRRKPFRPTKPMAISPVQAQRYEREKRLARKPAGRPWRHGYLGTGAGPWTRAGLYEHWGDLDWADVLRAQRFWPALLLVLGLDAVSDGGDRGYLDALANTLYHAFFRPPDQPSFGAKPDPHLMVALVISFIGAAVAFSKPAVVEEARPYPLSRADRSRLALLANAVTILLYVLGVGLGAFILAQGAGWAAGLPLRTDFVPFFLRAVLGTALVMPAVFWIRLRTRSFQNRPPGERGVVTLVWLIAMWIWITAWCFVIPMLLTRPATELLVTAALIGVSQWLYRQNLRRHFETADLT